uniref:uncharacterized protein n=1 Tax=Myxine glutinosa TaxID=7769 RepID=UPI00358FB702
MDKANQKRRKGGAEKERDRKKKKLSDSASKCRNLLDLFKSTNTGPGEVSEHGDKDTESVAGPSAAELVDDQLAAESVDAELVQIGEHEQVRSAERDVPAAAATLAEEGYPSINYFKKPCRDEDCLLFWNYHPNQKTDNRVVKRCFMRKDGTNRWRLSYNKDNHSLHCSVCLAFSSTSDWSTFIEGMTNWRHVHTCVEEHERSSFHLRCSTAYLVDRQQSSVSHLLARSHHDEVRKRRQVMERVVDVVKLIDKRGLSSRGSNEEAAYTLQ